MTLDITFALVTGVVAGIIGMVLLDRFRGSKYYKNKQFASMLKLYSSNVTQQISEKDPKFFSYFSLDPTMEFEYYIHQKGMKLSFERGNDTISTPLETNLEEYLLSVLENDDQSFYCVVGEFGTGKSSLLLYLFHEYIRKNHNKFPVLVTMKLFDKNGGGVDIIKEVYQFIKYEYNLEKLDYNLFRQHFYDGDIVVFLDGLDEYMVGKNRMPTELVTLRNNLGKKSKVIITSRPSAFRSTASFEGFFASFPNIQSFGIDSRIDIIEICFLETEQITNTLRLHDVPDKDIEFILSHNRILELCKQHVLLKMVVETLPSLNSNSKISDVYEKYIERCFSRNELIYSKQIYLVLGKIALWIIESDNDEITYDQIGIIKALNTNDIEIHFSQLVFITQTTGDSFRFIHRSFMEYFVARILCDAIRQNDFSSFSIFRNVIYNEEISHFTRELLKETDIPALLKLLENAEPWIRFAGAHYLSRINATNTKEIIMSLIDREDNFIIKRELYIAAAFLGEVGKFHEFVDYLKQYPDKQKENDRLIFDYFNSRVGAVTGCAERISGVKPYPTREMIIDFLGRYGDIEHISSIRQFIADKVESVIVAAENSIALIKSRFPKPRLVRYIILDMDGVIVNSIDDHISAWEKSVISFGFNFGETEAYKIRATEGKKSIEIVRELIQSHEISDGLANDIIKNKQELMNAIEVKLIDGVKEFIYLAKGKDIKIAVVTGSSNSWASYVLRTTRIDSLVDVTVTADDVKSGKPSPEPYKQALSKLGANSIHAIAVENSPYGIDSAQNANIYCIALTSTLEKKDLFFANEVIDDLLQMKKFL